MTAAHARAIAETFASLFESELPTTRKVLQAVGHGDSAYTPDPKSRTAWGLALHLATADVWFLDCIINGHFATDAEKVRALEGSFKTADEVVAFYDTAMTERIAALRALPDEALTRQVNFFGMFAKPAVEFLPMANNHSIHHRGQLAAYLRPMGSKVPSIYGSSADEGRG